jgi:hypothetical protein
MTSTHVDLDRVEWTPGSIYKGPDALYEGKEVFYRKVLSDRRNEGGGLAVLSKICPPPGKLVKTVAVARSEEHVFNLIGGRSNKSGKPIETPGNSTDPRAQSGEACPCESRGVSGSPLDRATTSTNVEHSPIQFDRTML